MSLQVLFLGITCTKMSVIQEYLATTTEPGNNYDRYTVAVLKEGTVVGQSSFAYWWKNSVWTY